MIIILACLDWKHENDFFFLSLFYSAKIAKLEDEIEHLKELAELKKERDRLKKTKKK